MKGNKRHCILSFLIISLCSKIYHKLELSNLYFCATWKCKPLKYQTLIIWSNNIHSLKYLWSTTLGSKDKRFVAKTQFLHVYLLWLPVACLFATNKLQNGWTSWARNFCGTSHDPRQGRFMADKNFKKFWSHKILKIQ